MLEWKLKAFNRLKSLKEPNWQKPKYPKIDYQDLYYYSAPKSNKEKPKSLDDVDPTTQTFNHSGNFPGVSAELVCKQGECVIVLLSNQDITPAFKIEELARPIIFGK